MNAGAESCINDTPWQSDHRGRFFQAFWAAAHAGRRACHQANEQVPGTEVSPGGRLMASR